MKVRITLDFDDDDRKRVRWAFGPGAGHRAGLATRAELINFIRGSIAGGLEDIAGDQLAEADDEEDGA